MARGDKKAALLRASIVALIACVALANYPAVFLPTYVAVSVTLLAALYGAFLGTTFRDKRQKQLLAQSNPLAPQKLREATVFIKLDQTLYDLNPDGTDIHALDCDS